MLFCLLLETILLTPLRGYSGRHDLPPHTPLVHPVTAAERCNHCMLDAQISQHLSWASAGVS